MKLSLETPGKRARSSKGKLWNTSRESKRYDHASCTSLCLTTYCKTHVWYKAFFLFFAVDGKEQFIFTQWIWRLSVTVQWNTYIFRGNSGTYTGRLVKDVEIASLTTAMLTLDSMTIVFQAKEQGKAEVEELLSKLEKVTNHYSLNCHVYINHDFLFFFQTNSEQQMKILELQDKLSKVHKITFVLTICNNESYSNPTEILIIDNVKVLPLFF